MWWKSSAVASIDVFPAGCARDDTGLFHKYRAEYAVNSLDISNVISKPYSVPELLKHQRL